jgi:D-glycero-D-manno-heptose 1,7-bisphosphate phosphatase
MNKAIFLDRDGVINIEKNYVHKIEEFEFYPETIPALNKIPQEYKRIIITNQGGIGKGYYTSKDYEKVTTHMLKQFINHGIRIDGIYHCPHHPSENCLCRKPGIQMLLDAQKDHNIDLIKSYLVGDKLSDMEAGNKAGCKTILVKTGHGIQEYNKISKNKIKPDHICENILHSIEYILEHK